MEMKSREDFKITTRDLQIDREIKNEKNRRPITLNVIPTAWVPHTPTFMINKMETDKNLEISGKTYRTTPNETREDRNKKEALEKIYKNTGKNNGKKIKNKEEVTKPNDTYINDMVQSTSDRCMIERDNIRKLEDETSNYDNCKRIKTDDTGAKEFTMGPIKEEILEMTHNEIKVETDSDLTETSSEARPITLCDKLKAKEKEVTLNVMGPDMIPNFPYVKGTTWDQTPGINEELFSDMDIGMENLDPVAFHDLEVVKELTQVEETLKRMANEY